MKYYMNLIENILSKGYLYKMFAINKICLWTFPVEHWFNNLLWKENECTQRRVHENKDIWREEIFTHTNHLKLRFIATVHSSGFQT